MPRVHTKTKSTRGKVYNCQSCGQGIEPGQSFYEWSRRFGRSGQTYRQHTACGRPRPTQLSSRKTAVLEEAIDAMDFSVFTFDLDESTLSADVGGTIEIDVSDLEAMLSEIAECAREIGQEYQDGFDNMPEGLNQGSTAQAMEEVAQELESWADDLESTDLDAEVEYEALEIIEEATDEEAEEARQEWIEEIQNLIDDKVSELVQAAQDACQDYPEYQG